MAERFSQENIKVFRLMTTVLNLKIYLIFSEMLLQNFEVFKREQDNVVPETTTTEVNDSDIQVAIESFAENIEVEDEVVEDCGTITAPPVGEFCMYCTNYERVRTVDQIKRGDSIRFPRKNGLYYHHAIVADVQKNEQNNTLCVFTLIHLKK